MAIVMQGDTRVEEIKRQHRVEEGARQLVRRMLIFTIQDCLDIWEYRSSRRYHFRYQCQFGFSKNANPEEAYQRVAARIREWTSSQRFKDLCKKVDLDSDKGALVIEQLLQGEGREKVGELLEEFKGEVQHYVHKGPRPRAAAGTTGEEAARPQEAPRSKAGGTGTRGCSPRQRCH